MRKKILLLALALTSVAGALSASLIGSGGSHPCQQCTTLSNGAQCCISCVCNAAGIPLACAQNACAELDPP
jgi:hypothetical protein